eukprot:784861-Prorocentrum_lima.AAC.1
MVTHNHLFVDDPVTEMRHQEQQAQQSDLIRTAPPSLSGLDMQDVMFGSAIDPGQEDTKEDMAATVVKEATLSS